MAGSDERPLPWRDGKVCGHYGLSRLVECRGDKGYVIEECFATCLPNNCDVTSDLRAEMMKVHRGEAGPAVALPHATSAPLATETPR